MTNAPATLVCFAVKEEAQYFKKLARSHLQIGVLLTGMGRRNAQEAVGAALAESRPERVITAGFAGGLRADLVTGTVVFLADEATGLEARLREAGARAARFYCAERVVSTAAQKRALHATTGADVVEMESQAIHSLCRQHQVPAAIVRVILDTAAEDLVLDFNQLMTPDQRLDGRKLAMELLKSPMKIRALLRLQRQSASAARRLGEVLGRALQLC